jgi:hypothetical protein
MELGDVQVGVGSDVTLAVCPAPPRPVRPRIGPDQGLGACSTARRHQGSHADAASALARVEPDATRSRVRRRRRHVAAALGCVPPDLRRPGGPERGRLAAARRSDRASQAQPRAARRYLHRQRHWRVDAQPEGSLAVPRHDRRRQGRRGPRNRRVHVRPTCPARRCAAWPMPTTWRRRSWRSTSNGSRP